MDAIHTFVVSLSIALIGYFLNYLFTKKPKLRYYYGAITEIRFPITPTNPSEPAGEPLGSALESPDTQINSNQAHTNQATSFNFIRTHTVVISNQGNATAKNIRIGHAYLPAFSVSPAVNTRNPDNENEILVPTLCAKEYFTISYLYSRPIFWHQINTYFKCDEGAAEKANMQDISIKSPFLIWMINCIFFVGIFSVIYFLIQFFPVLYKLYLLGTS